MFNNLRALILTKQTTITQYSLHGNFIQSEMTSGKRKIAYPCGRAKIQKKSGGQHLVNGIVEKQFIKN